MPACASYLHEQKYLVKLLDELAYLFIILSDELLNLRNLLDLIEFIDIICLLLVDEIIIKCYFAKNLEGNLQADLLGIFQIIIGIYNYSNKIYNYQRNGYNYL